MNPDAWKPTLRTEREYSRAIERFIREQFPWLPALTPEGELEFPTSGRAAEAVQEIAEQMARAMVKRVDVTNARHWREAASKSLHGKSIYEALRREMGSAVGMRVSELVRSNARIIQRLPERLAKQTQAWVGAQQRAGRRADQIVAELEARLPRITRTQARMVARTEIARAETALTQARAERLNIQWYEWATSEDQRVRPSHKLFDNVLVAWADPPNPEQMAGEPSSLGHYHPGGAFNCRCLALPLIDLNEVRWPHKVYAHGRIEFVHKAIFERWIRLPQAA